MGTGERTAWVRKRAGGGAGCRGRLEERRHGEPEPRKEEHRGGNFNRRNPGRNRRREEERKERKKKDSMDEKCRQEVWKIKGEIGGGWKIKGGKEKERKEMRKKKINEENIVKCC